MKPKQETELQIIQPELNAAIQNTKIEYSKAEQHALAFAPSMQEYLTYAEIVKGLDKINPTELDAKKAREARLKLVKVRTSAEEIKDLRKEGIRAEGDLIQALFNVVKNSCLVTETEFTEIEKHQERQEVKRQAELAESRKKQLIKYGTDTSYLPLGIMTNEQFSRLLENESLAFAAKVEAAEKVEAARIETERLAEEARQEQLRLQAERIEAERLEAVRIKAELAEKEALLAKEREESRIAAEKLAKENEAKLAEQARLAKIEADRKDKVAAEQLAEKEKQQDRQSKMFSLGLKWDGETFQYEDINFHWTDLLCMTDEKFDTCYMGTSKRMEALQAEKLAKEAQENDHVSKLAAELKAKQDAEEKERKIFEAQAKANRDKEEAALRAPDKDKVRQLFEAIKAIQIPEFGTEQGRAIGSLVMGGLKVLQADIINESKKLV